MKANFIKPSKMELSLSITTKSQYDKDFKTALTETEKYWKHILKNYRWTKTPEKISSGRVFKFIFSHSLISNY